MSIRYSEDFKKEVVKAYMAGDRSIHQLAVEFNVAKSSVSKWANEYREECLYTTGNPSAFRQYISQPVANIETMVVSFSQHHQIII